MKAQTQLVKLFFAVPVFVGKRDYTTDCHVAFVCPRKLQAHVNGFYTFRNSGHSPLFMEPQFARKVLQDNVLFQRMGFTDVIW